MTKRYFSLGEANALLSYLEPMMRSLQDLKREIDTKYDALQMAKYEAGVPHLQGHDAFFAQEAALEFLIYNAQSLLDQIHATGVEVKDIEMGLLDFYSLIDEDEEVLLCWRLGEQEIRYWHGVHEGFQSRKPIFFDF